MRSTTLVLITWAFASCATRPEPAPIPNDAVGYKRAVEDCLGPIWYRLVEANNDSLQVGTVDTTFEIRGGGGPVRNLRITSNTGGKMDELVARAAIDQLRVPPIPPEILAKSHEDYIVLKESFTVLSEADRPSGISPKKR